MTQTVPANNALRLKMGGGRLGAIDPAAIAKAEAALKNLAGNFDKWLADEIAKLAQARADAGTEGFAPTAVQTLYLRAHDLKGLGTTYGFPIVTRIAGSLCKLIDDQAKRGADHVDLIDAHIDAIKAAVRDDIKADDHPVGRVLVEELERQAAERL